MKDDEASHNPLTNGRNAPQMVILTQLLQAMTAMQHIDELMSWLANLIVYRFGVQVAQIWATQNNQQSRPSLELRSTAYQDSTFPQNIVVNAQVMLIAEQFIVEKRSSSVQSVDVIFPQYLSLLLKRRGLNYFASSFFSSPFLLPPSRTENTPGKLPTPLNMTVMLFFHQIPSQDLQPFISFVYQQAIQIARNRDLLLPATATISSPQMATANTSSHQVTAALPELIPRRLQDATSNPLVSVRLPDKQARRLYALIDGKKSIRVLSEAAQIEMKIVVTLLQALVTQRYVRVHEPSGQPVDDSIFLNYR